MVNGCYLIALVTLFVTNAVKLQKLPEIWFIKHNKKSRTQTSIMEA